MRNKITGIIGGILIGALLSYGAISFAQSGLWYPLNNNLRPVVSTWGLQIPSITNGCLTSGATGIITSTGAACGGAGTGLDTWVINGTTMYSSTTIQNILMGGTTTSTAGFWFASSTSNLTIKGDFSATNLYGDGSNLTGVGVAAASALTISAKAAENLTKGDIVYVSGATGQFPQVMKADNTSDAKHFFIGVAAETKSTGQTILIRVRGELTGLNLSAYNDGDSLYLSTNGTATNTVPTSGATEHVGYVTYNHATQGKLVVMHHAPHSISAPSSADIYIRMGGNTATSAVSFKSYSNEEVGVINALGNLTFKGRILTGYGSLGAPAFSFSADSNTGIYGEDPGSGMYFSSDGILLLNMRTLSTPTFNWNATPRGDYDFQVAGVGILPLLYVEAGSSRVGIATATPAYLLDVYGAASVKDLIINNNAVIGKVWTASSTSGLGYWATSEAGVTDHALLSNLDYTNSGHIGFLSTTTAASTYLPIIANADVDLGVYNLTTNDLTVEGIFIASGDIDMDGNNLVNMGSLIPPSGNSIMIRDFASNLNAVFDTSLLTTSDKTFTFPDASGTFALSGTLTNTKWCSTDGTVINCTQDAPAGGGVSTLNNLSGALTLWGTSPLTVTASGTVGLVFAYTEADPKWVASSTSYLTLTGAATNYVSTTTGLTYLTSAIAANTYLATGTAASTYFTISGANASNTSWLADTLWSGVSTGLNAATGRASLGLGDSAVLASSTWFKVANNLSEGTAATMRTNLGLGDASLLASSTWAKVANNLSDLQSTSTARTNLGLVIGTNVQAYHANLAAISGGTWTGASSITTLGTIGTGIWQGTPIAYNYGGTGTSTALANQYLWWGNGSGGLVQVASSTLAGTGGGVSSLNTYTGALTIWGTNNNLTVTASSTVGLVLNIGTNVATTGVATLSSLNSVGTITTGTWNATAIANTKGGTGQDTSGWTGIPKIAAGTWATTTLKFCFSLENASTTDDNVPIWTPDANITLKRQYCRVEGGTSVAIFTSDGTNVQETITCTTAGAADDGTLTNATYSANERMEFDIVTVTGSVTWLNFCSFYTVD